MEEQDAEKVYYLGSDTTYWALYSYHIGDYMSRWCLRWWKGRSIRLHHIKRSDRDRALHDHPIEFWTFLLTGSYREELPVAFGTSNPATRKVKRRWGSVRWVDADTPHRVEVDRPIWTLIFARRIPGKKWGFYVGGFELHNWVHNKTYGHRA